MMNNNKLVIESHELSKTYKNVLALKSQDLKVAQHSIFGFLGPNGAGKTTAIKLLLGLARPTSGGGSIFGYDIQHQSVEIRRRAGYLAQDPRYYESMTARDTLHFTLGFFFKGPKDKIEDVSKRPSSWWGWQTKPTGSWRWWNRSSKLSLPLDYSYLWSHRFFLDRPTRIKSD